MERSGGKSAGLIVPAANKDRILKIAPGDEIPSAASKFAEQINMMLLGGSEKPKRAIIAFAGADYAEIDDALKALGDEDASYVALSGSAEGQAAKVVAWVKEQREIGKSVKAVLPDNAADNEAIINFSTESVTVGEKLYTAEQYCARICGLLAGTPITESATYSILSDATDCTRLSKEEMDAAVDASKLILFYDAGEVRIARAVNSLTTKTDQKGDQYKKIKLVDVMDTMRNDIRSTIRNEWIGKKSNAYDNKCLLIAAVQGYMDNLVAQNVLESATVSIDVAGNKKYLTEHGVDTTEMSSDEIKQANTGDKVFLIAQIQMNDAIEDVYLEINI